MNVESDFNQWAALIFVFLNLLKNGVSEICLHTRGMRVSLY